MSHNVCVNVTVTRMVLSHNVCVNATLSPAWSLSRNVRAVTLFPAAARSEAASYAERPSSRSSWTNMSVMFANSSALDAPSRPADDTSSIMSTSSGRELARYLVPVTQNSAFSSSGFPFFFSLFFFFFFFLVALCCPKLDFFPAPRHALLTILPRSCPPPQRES